MAAVPAFRDSAFHHLEHVIAFDDNKRIVARELSTVSENTEPPALQVQSASADVVLGQEGFRSRGLSRGNACEQLPRWAFCFKGRIDGWRFIHNLKA